MPDAAPVRLPTEQALDELLAALYRRVEAEPAPEGLLWLVDRLEAASPSPVAGEPRTL